MECRLSTDWKSIKELIIYGFGKVSKDNLDFFRKQFDIVYIVDSDKTKCDCEYKGIEVKHIDDVQDLLRKYKIVIMTANRNATSIGKKLTSFGLERGKDFCSMEEFLTEWFWQYQKKVCLMEVHSTITSRCTLKCKHCNMFMPYYKEHVDYTAQEIVNDLSLLFRHVDYIVSYKLLGGEPLINQELLDMIKMIGERYGKKIGSIGIITNGTILPSDELLEVSKKYDVRFDFSDYTETVGYKEQFEKAIQLVKDAGLKYSVNNTLRWCDFGFPEHNRCYSFDEVRDHMLSCGPIFHGINDGKYYYCHVSWSADKAKLLRNAIDDYIDLSTLEDGDEAKEKILNHSKGKIEKGFVKLCKICGGCGNDNTEFVKAAEQVKKV